MNRQPAPARYPDLEHPSYGEKSRSTAVGQDSGWSTYDPQFDYKNGLSAGGVEPNVAPAAPNAPVPDSTYATTQRAAGMPSDTPGRGPSLEVLCGPLLNYRHMTEEETETPVWHGSVLLVTKPGETPPELRLRFAGPVDGHANNGSPHVDGLAAPDDVGHEGTVAPSTVTGFKLYSDRSRAFWRVDLPVPLRSVEASWQYEISNAAPTAGLDSKPGAVKTFVVPSKHQSMRVMFHSCNGFSVGADVEAWSGPALWHDVMRFHRERPFHVMIGGGDQIYNDSIRVDGPLQEWTGMDDPKKRQDHPFTEDFRARCDDYYCENYVRWFSTEPFASANAQIPQINIWDDHDIIDGFGSYVDHFMRCDVFRGIGGIAHKYYLLFQHHAVPPSTTFSSAETRLGLDSVGLQSDTARAQAAYVLKDPPREPSWISGRTPGPYVPEPSRSIYARLGKGMAFVGFDARTERTRHQINYPETYDLIFDRVDRELSRAGGRIKHLLVLLGVPIAYPRLMWLESILRSPLIAPIRFLNKHFGIASGLFNNFDGQVDLLDDLDDHYTARQHKGERKMLTLRLQELGRRHGVRVTILSGDVHLGALGRFYSKPRLGIPVFNDHRYIVNIVSSAITNQPPPAPVANMLARRNKIHRFDHETSETLLDMFDKAPGDRPKGAASNHCTMPSRNYAILTQTTAVSPTAAAAAATAAGTAAGHSNLEEQLSNGAGGLTNGSIAATNGTSSGRGQQQSNGEGNDQQRQQKQGHPHHHHLFSHKGDKNGDGRGPLHPGEQDAGTTHPAASGLEVRNLPDEPHGLDVCYRVEIDRDDNLGHTDGYGMHSECFLSAICCAVSTFVFSSILQPSTAPTPFNMIPPPPSLSPLSIHSLRPIIIIIIILLPSRRPSKLTRRFKIRSSRPVHLEILIPSNVCCELGVGSSYRWGLFFFSSSYHRFWSFPFKR